MSITAVSLALLSRAAAVPLVAVALALPAGLWSWTRVAPKLAAADSVPVPSEAAAAQSRPSTLSLQSLHEQRVPKPSTAQRCPDDALVSVFAFLPLADLAAALRACRSWYAASGKEASRGLHIRVSSALIGGMKTSPLRHHVVGVSFASGAPTIDLNQLRVLRLLPRLTSLEAEFDLADLDARMQQADGSRQRRAQLVRDALPLRLRRLAWGVHGHFAALSARQAVLDVLPHLAQLSDLHLRMQTRDADLAPLLRLSPHLTRLDMQLPLTPTQCSAIKQMASLTTLECTSGAWRDTLLDLCQPPHSLLRLQRLTLDTLTVDPPLLAALRRLPALTELRPDRIAPACWAGLAQLARLRSLRVRWSPGCSSDQRADLQSALAALPHLSDLTLQLESYPPFLRAPAAAAAGDPDAGGAANLSLDPMLLMDVSPLVLRLPALRRLQLQSMRVSSLRGFVQHAPLLEELRLHVLYRPRTAAGTQSGSGPGGQSGSGPPPSPGEDLLGLLAAHTPRLRALTVGSACVQLSADQRARLQPPSSLLPQLRSFSYWPVAGMSSSCSLL